MNKVFLRGNVGQEPKITTFQNGGKMASFSLATTERGYKLRDGREIEAQTTWHNIVVRQPGLAEVCEKYVRKGMPLLVVGKIQEHKYESNGQMRKMMEIVVEELELLSPKKQDDDYVEPCPLYE